MSPIPKAPATLAKSLKVSLRVASLCVSSAMSPTSRPARVAAPTAIAVYERSSAPAELNNANVIAYPITNALTNVQSANMTNNQLCQGLCYVIRMGNSQNGNIVQTLSAVPLKNTYSVANDRAGTYQAVITISANRNP